MFNFFTMFSYQKYLWSIIYLQVQLFGVISLFTASTKNVVTHFPHTKPQILDLLNKVQTGKFQSMTHQKSVNRPRVRHVIKV